MARQRLLNNTGVVQNSLYPDPVYDNQIQDESFSDLSYQDMGGIHPPRSHSGLQSVMPHALSNFRNNNAINYGSTYPEGPHQTNMADISGEVGEYSSQPGHGIDGINVAQKKNWDWSNLPTLGNVFKKVITAAKDNPTEAFNRSKFTTYGDGSQRIAKHPMDNVFANKNVSSLLSSGDLSIGGQKRTDRITAAINAMNEDDPESGKFSQLYNKDKAAWNRRLTTLKNRERVFANQLREYNADLVTKGLKEKAAVDMNKQRVAADRAAGAFSSQVQRDPGGGRDWHQQTAAKERQGQSVAGPGFGSGSYFNQGGRAGYANGDMVAQETDFIEGPQGDEAFQETVVEGQEQPSREQLEALAMEIFQLPLEELDEQQLLVVYQEAMQGQPMEEAVEEDEVQFAAQGGLAGLL